MCVQFHAVRLVITTGPAVGLDHDGHPYTNEDFPKGTVLAYDADNNLYHYIALQHEGIFSALEKPENWPPVVRKQGVRLYRDHWRHISSGPFTPYGAAIRNAPHRVLREMKS